MTGASAPVEVAPGSGFERFAALAPLATYGYRVLLTAQLIGILGRWMQSLAAQWSLVDTSPVMVALVPTAMSVPVVLFALVAGAWADMVDRRKMLLVTQAALGLTAALLATLSLADLDTPWLVLGLMFVMGAWTAANMPPFQSAVSELVPKHHIVQAATLTAVGANIGRAVGPAIAGIAIVLTGLAGGYALAAACYLVAFIYTARVGALGHPDREASSERIVDALRSGMRYARGSGMTQRVLFWTLVYVGLNAALWALLPTLAASELGLGAAGYGMLLGAIGVGAVLGALVMPVAKKRWSQNELFAIAIAITGGAAVICAAVANVWVVGAVLVPLGTAYIVIIAITNGTLQLLLPTWVRARGLAIYVVAFHVATAVGSAAWGVVGAAIGVNGAFAVSGTALLLSVPLLRWIRVPEIDRAERSEPAPWPEPQLELDVHEADGPVHSKP